MRNLFSGKKIRIILALLAALLMGIFTAAVSDSGTSPLSSAVSVIVSPLQSLSAKIAENLDDFNGYFVSSKKYAERIEELESEADELRSQLVDYHKTLHKLEAYENFLDVKEENPDFSFIPAEIILMDTSDICGSFTLNKGSLDGIRINSPVIAGDILVGIVKGVSSKSCTVLTVYNPSVSISAYEIRTREDCYTEAELSLSENGLIKLGGLSKTTAIVSGGLVCTSGLGGLYPKDLIIGTVKELKTDEPALSSYALIEPLADIRQLTDVFIITDFEGKA